MHISIPILRIIKESGACIAMEKLFSLVYPSSCILVGILVATSRTNASSRVPRQATQYSWRVGSMGAVSYCESLGRFASILYSLQSSASSSFFLGVGFIAVSHE